MTTVVTCSSVLGMTKKTIEEVDAGFTLGRVIQLDEDGNVLVYEPYGDPWGYELPENPSQ